MYAVSLEWRVSKAWRVFVAINGVARLGAFLKLKSSERPSILARSSYCQNPTRQIAAYAIFAVANPSMCGYRFVTNFSGAN